ncbi:MAG: hypothetical protein WCE21_05920 [Candidatus Babeliales bacterium]
MEKKLILLRVWSIAMFALAHQLQGVTITIINKVKDVSPVVKTNTHTGGRATSTAITVLPTTYYDISTGTFFDDQNGIIQTITKPIAYGDKQDFTFSALPARVQLTANNSSVQQTFDAYSDADSITLTVSIKMGFTGIGQPPTKNLSIDVSTLKPIQMRVTPSSIPAPKEEEHEEQDKKNDNVDQNYALPEGVRL